eukprot:TRINITY_DN8074_c0_g1_i1.p1 TRINITY_DN8074_c0_g1~~TRINITY_DN8074_c0_g1_i1.p1  ORF type:complete len:239 (+),score=13.86 TRINITY_DN8074_c0_g1_i1:188-904(+)
MNILRRNFRVQNPLRKDSGRPRDVEETGNETCTGSPQHRPPGVPLSTGGARTMHPSAYVGAVTTPGHPPLHQAFCNPQLQTTIALAGSGDASPGQRKRKSPPKRADYRPLASLSDAERAAFHAGNTGVIAQPGQGFCTAVPMTIVRRGPAAPVRAPDAAISSVPMLPASPTTGSRAGPFRGGAPAEAEALASRGNSMHLSRSSSQYGMHPATPQLPPTSGAPYALGPPNGPPRSGSPL